MPIETAPLSRVTLLIVLSTLALCGACRSPESEDADRSDLGIEIEFHSFEKTGGECAEDATGPCVRFFVEYPEISAAPDETLMRTFNAGIRELILAPRLAAAEPDGPQAMADQFIEQWNRTRAEFPESASLDHFMEHHVKVIYRDEALISVESAEEAYSGGAHPNTASRYVSFATTDGHSLTLDELLVPGFRPRLNEIAERLFREMRNIPAEQSLADAGFWFDDGFVVNDNFAVVEAGLLFHFDAYEIGPYSAGPTKLVIGRKELGDLVPQNSPLGK